MRTIIRIFVGIALTLTLMLIQMSIVWSVYIQLFTPISFLSIAVIVFLTNTTTFLLFAILNSTITPTEGDTL